MTPEQLRLPFALLIYRLQLAELAWSPATPTQRAVVQIGHGLMALNLTGIAYRIATLSACDTDLYCIDDDNVRYLHHDRLSLRHAWLTPNFTIMCPADAAEYFVKRLGKWTDNTREDMERFVKDYMLQRN